MCDATNLCGIFLRIGSNCIWEPIGKGDGYVLARVNGIVICVLYFSPNRLLSEFEEYLKKLSLAMEPYSRVKLLVAGDLSARFTAWRNHITRLREKVMEVWADSFPLYLLKKGKGYTCVREKGGSVVDVAWGTRPLVRAGVKWFLDAQTYSDHRYVRMEIGMDKRTQPNTASSRKQISTRCWNFKKLDADRFVALLETVQ